MTMTNKIVSVVALAALVAGVVVVPGVSNAADDVTQENKNTGNRSRNRNRTRIVRDHAVNHTNTADVTNAAAVAVNTGGNDQNENTTVNGDQESGEVIVSATVATDVNAATPPAPAALEDADIDQTNENTGNRSRNRNRATVRQTSTTTLNNTATVGNSASVNGTTGNNNQNQNTTAGDQTSGDVEVTLNFTTIAN